MKRKLFAVVTLIAIILLAGCDNIGIIRGTGAMISRDYPVEDFNAVEIGGSGNVIFKQSSDCSLTIEMQENLFEYLEVTVRNDTLIIGFRSGINITFGNNTPQIYIYTPMLESVYFSGAVSAADWDMISTQKFSLKTSGAGDINIGLEVDVLDVNLSGAAMLELSGTAGATDIVTSGAGSISALKFQTRDANITVSGAGGAEIAVSDNLNVTISGVGSVRYLGDPNITKDISGVGSLTKIN